jgi:glycosyltransferase involved in cell wall biosynthesis
MFLVILAAVTFGFWLFFTQEIVRGNRRMRRLATLADPPPARWPRVSLVFAARNEGHTVGRAVPTMLALDYPDFEVIAVDDRSEDDTSAQLERLAVEHAGATAGPRLHVVRIAELPPGWLGKNHALHLGAQRATGEWILFTDADIHFTRDALRRAVAHAVARHLDLLAAVPQLNEDRHALGICVNAFGFSFTIGIRPWRIPHPKAKAHGSVGAFGLVRTAKYRELGGHEPIRLRPDDDIKLGKHFKNHGGRCELLHGVGALSVAWYDSVSGMVRGLTKNAYAGADYRPWVPPLGALAQATVLLWPLAALALTSGLVWWLNAGSVALVLALGCDQTRFTGGRWWYGLFLPFGVAVFSYILLRSMVVTHWRRGIVWRGTYYPLAALKANRL